CRVSAAAAPRGREHCACPERRNSRASPPAPPLSAGVFVVWTIRRGRPMHALKEEAFLVRPAGAAGGPALDQAIATVDEETEFLAVPGEYLRRWAPGFAERLATMNAKGTGAYFLAEHGGEIVSFLGAYAGALERARGIVYIAHVGVRRAWRSRGVGS